MKILVAQLNPTIGDFEGNLKRILNVLKSSQKEDLVVFPELTLSGYYPQDLVEDAHFLERQANAMNQVLAASQNSTATLVLGQVTQNKGSGKPFHNSLIVVRKGEVLLTYHKQLLPTYNVFDERRHFEPGPNVPALVEVAGTKVGFLICEDGWNLDGSEYAVNPWRALSQAAPDLVVSINASPSNIGKRQERHQLFSDAAAQYNFPVLYVNQVGGNDSLVYDGASFAVHPQLGVVWELPAFLDTTGKIDFEKGKFLTARDDYRGRILYAEDSEFYWEQIRLGVLDYFRKTGFSTAVVGCSGGIDSALVLALACEALGPENVTAITMPSRFSSQGSVTDSEQLCNNLGVALVKHPIQPIVDRYSSAFVDYFKTPQKRLTLENLQARIRGTILMEHSNQTGALLLTTGNKSEISCGYFTLYGDSNGGLNPIGDLYKTEVFALSRWINLKAGRELIPLEILEKAPSAELSEGQKDTDSLPPYETLDEILKLLVEGPRLRPEELDRARSFVECLTQTIEGASVVSNVRRLLRQSEFKRRQAPPIIRVRGRSFGSGRQVPVAAVY